MLTNFRSIFFGFGVHMDFWFFFRGKYHRKSKTQTKLNSYTAFKENIEQKLQGLFFT